MGTTYGDNKWVKETMQRERQRMEVLATKVKRKVKIGSQRPRVGISGPESKNPHQDFVSTNHLSYSVTETLYTQLIG